MQRATAGTVLLALGGGTYIVSEDLTRVARAERRKDGRPRLPPGQKVISQLKPMGGDPGDPKTSAFRLKVHGLVKNPFTLDFAAMAAMNHGVHEVDVHCVTGWSVLGAKFRGVRVKDLAQKAGVHAGARHVIFEAAHGYTANVPLDEAMGPNVLIAWELDGRRLAHAHGGPARAVVPDLYFWKSAKWLTGIRFVQSDEPGYWETRGYHNRADPWKEQRHS